MEKKTDTEMAARDFLYEARPSLYDFLDTSIVVGDWFDMIVDVMEEYVEYKTQAK